MIIAGVGIKTREIRVRVSQEFHRSFPEILR